MKKILICLLTTLFAIQLKAQNIQDLTWWFDGYTRYSVSISGQFVNLFGESADHEPIQTLLRRFNKTRYTLQPVGVGQIDAPYRAEHGWGVEHVVHNGKEYLVVQKPDGSAVWTLTKTDLSLEECVAKEKELEAQPWEGLLDTFMMNTTYLSKFNSKQLDQMRQALEKRLMSGQQLSVIGKTNLQLIISESMLSDYMRHGVRVPDLTNKHYDKQIVVHNAEEFFDALGSNREVIIDENVVIDITEGLNAEGFASKPGRLEVGSLFNEVDADQEAIVSEMVTDGRQLVLNSMKHLAIRGRKGAMLYADPRYSFVLSLSFCEDVVIDNLILGHSFSGYCNGGVINVENSQDVVINRCDLFGCGTYGLCTRRADRVVLMNSFIRHCTYGITDLNESKHLTFYNCDIFANKEFSLFNSWGNEDVIIDSCRFFSNYPESPLFSMNHPIVMGNNQILHPMGHWGTVEFVSAGHLPNAWIDGNYQAPQFRGIGPDCISAWTDLLVPNNKDN
jgi:hypothetical protein